MFRALFGHHTTNEACQCSLETVMTLHPLITYMCCNPGKWVTPIPYCSHCSIRGEDVLGPCLFLKITISISDMDKLSLLYLIFHRFIIYQSVTVHSPFPSKETVFISCLQSFSCVPIATCRSPRMCFFEVDLKNSLTFEVCYPPVKSLFLAPALQMEYCS